jgi:hypothetical protein
VTRLQTTVTFGTRRATLRAADRGLPGGNPSSLVHAALIRRLALSALLFSLVAACCPPLQTSYSTPEETLRTWQSQLCHDQPEGEYRCLSRSLQQAMGGFETYFPARQQLLNDNPIVGLLVQHADLPGRVVESAGNSEGDWYRLVFEESDQRFAIEFITETLVTFHLRDGNDILGLLEKPLEGYLGRDETRQWLMIPKPRLTPEQQAAVRSLTFEEQWKISSIDGLESLPEVHE